MYEEEDEEELCGFPPAFAVFILAAVLLLELLPVELLLTVCNTIISASAIYIWLLEDDEEETVGKGVRVG